MHITTIIQVWADKTASQKKHINPFADVEKGNAFMDDMSEAHLDRKETQTKREY